MKQMIGIIAAVLGVATMAHAGLLDQKAGSCTVAVTATNTFVLGGINGQIDNMVFTIGTVSTASVSVATSDGVIIYAADLTAATDGKVYPRLELAPLTGGAITNTANSVWMHAIIGDLTCTVIGKPANTATSTVSAVVNYIKQ